MTMHEKLMIHREIEKANAQSVQRWKNENRVCDYCRKCAKLGKSCEGKTRVGFWQCFTL